MIEYTKVLSQLEAELAHVEMRRDDLMQSIAALRRVVAGEAVPVAVRRIPLSAKMIRTTLRTLASGPKTINELVRETGFKKLSIAPMLTKLRKQALVEHIEDGQWRTRGRWALARQGRAFAEVQDEQETPGRGVRLTCGPAATTEVALAPGGMVLADARRGAAEMEETPGEDVTAA